MSVDNPLSDAQPQPAAGVGVATGGGGEVTDWADQSPNLNDAAQRTPGEEPLLVSNAINGKPVLRFDGADDYLEIPNSASLQPLSGDWTVFFVAKRLAASQGDFPQIIGSRPWTAGLDKGWSVSMDGAGLVASHYADGSTGHDVPQVRAASALSLSSAQVWQVEENRTAGRTRFSTAGVSDSNWHRYGVHFDQPNDRLIIYVDRVLRTNINLATFADGAVIFLSAAMDFSALNPW